ncbi:MAG: N-acetylglucosaminyl-diphospho-decaprenol L-rhamnosyltransferase, partial [Actinomycetota bacterium]
MSAAVDVVVVAFRSESVIGACLERAFAIPNVGKVVVVDNGDGASAVLARQMGAIAIEHVNSGFGSGQNAGVALTDAPYVLLLNPDALVEPDAIASGVRRLDAQPSVAAVQGVIVNRTTGALERSHGRPLGAVHLVGRAVGARRAMQSPLVRAAARRIPGLTDSVDRAPSVDTLTDSLAATAVVVRRAAFDAVGGFDERYFLYGEDIDLCR